MLVNVVLATALAPHFALEKVNRVASATVDGAYLKLDIAALMEFSSSSQSPFGKLRKT
jgi:hypothetical protein